MNNIVKGASNFLLALAILSIAGCKKDSNDNNNMPQPPAKEIQLKSNATLGNILVDKTGRTLYFFSNDANGQNSCGGQCEAYWPYFNVDNLTADKLGDGLSLSDFASITTANNKKQVTYKGWPLYYFAPDGVTQEAAGATSGEGVNGVWFVAKPDYTIMIVSSQLVGHDGKNYKSDYTEGLGNTTYFTDGRGLTLYTFKLDSLNKNTFTNSDFSNNAVWPIYETNKVVVPSTLDKTKFGSITVFGRNQLTYKGWPLYYFGQDANVRGSNKGISFPAPGYWPVPVQDLATAPQ